MLEKSRSLWAGALALAVVLGGCGGGASPPASAPLSSARAPLAAPATANYPFGSRRDSYAAGIRLGIANSTADQQIHQWYSDWAAARLRTTPKGIVDVASGTCQGGYAVSEGTGFAMLITVVMAGDPAGDLDAKGKFDGLYAAAANNPATSIPSTYTFTDNGQQLLARDHLMAWCLDSTGTANGDNYAAMDGDLDIALALLMADRQWGSDPTDGSPYNYRQRAIRKIKAIRSVFIDDAGNINSSMRRGETRTSDFMIGHFRAFAQATGDSIWNTVIDRSFSVINRMQGKALGANGQSTGLLPDWIKYSNDDAAMIAWPNDQASPDYQLGAGNYAGNAQRDPWRFASDYVFSNDPRWTGSSGALTRIAQFFSANWNNTPGSSDKTSYNTGIYSLNGTRINTYESTAIAGAVMASALVSPQYQALLDNSWNWIQLWHETGYYESEIALLSMLVVSGNWWLPTQGTVTPPPQTPYHLEAESGTLQGAGVGIHTDIAGYSGSGFVGSFTTNGDALTLNFPNVAAGSYDVKIRYHAWGAQQNNVVINGVSRSMQWPVSTPTTSDWVTLTIPGVSMNAGTNTVQITKDWGYIEVDWVELVASGTGGTSSPVKVQAENASWQGSGVAVHNDLAGFEGTGFVGSFTANGDSLSANFTGLAAGTYTVTIRYHAWGPQQNNVIINGASRSVQWPASTPTTSDWVTLSIPNVSLTAGTNTVTISKDWGYIDVDWIQVTPQ